MTITPSLLLKPGRGAGATFQVRTPSWYQPDEIRSRNPAWICLVSGLTRFILILTGVSSVASATASVSFQSMNLLDPRFELEVLSGQRGFRIYPQAAGCVDTPGQDLPQQTLGLRVHSVLVALGLPNQDL